jgi:hypothetical protein
MKKTRGRKSRVRVPLSTVEYFRMLPCNRKKNFTKYSITDPLYTDVEKNKESKLAWIRATFCMKQEAKILGDYPGLRHLGSE